MYSCFIMSGNNKSLFILEKVTLQIHLIYKIAYLKKYKKRLLKNRN